MLKHIDDIRKSARERAQRRWKNYQTIKSMKAAQKKAAEDAAKEPTIADPGDVLEQNKLIKKGTTKFESKFIKEIRSIMNENLERDLTNYLAHLQHRKKLLLKEKLRRLLAAQGESQ